MTTKSESLTEVGIREFRSHMSAYLERVKEGETIVLTDQGKPIVRLTSEPQAAECEPETVEDKIWKMVREGTVHWNGQRFTPPTTRIRARGNKLVSEMLLEDRD